MKSNKNLYSYLIFMSLLCTFCHHTFASEKTQSTLQQSTSTTPATPSTSAPKAEAATNTSTAAPTPSASPAAKTVVPTPSPTAAPSTPAPEAADKKQNESTNLQICKNADTPLEKLDAQELEALLDCTQQQQNKIENSVQNIETVLQKKNPKQARKIKSDNRKNKKINAQNAKNPNRCPYSNTPLKNLKAKQLEEVYQYTTTHKMDAAFMIDLLTRLIALSDNHASVKQYKLQLADTHYNAHHIEKAAAFYEDFAVLYPSSPETEYVLYKAVACMFELSLEPDRDQTNTKKTIVLIKEFLKNAKKAELIEEAKSMLQSCYTRLFDHEVYVCNFYIRKKNAAAAELRIEYIEKTFKDTIAHMTTKVQELKKQVEELKNPPKKSLLSSLLSDVEMEDNGPVDTKKNKATKFLA